MPITRTPQVDDDGSGTTGTIWNNAWKQELYGQIDAFVDPGLGAWTVTPYDAAHYVGASPMVWTVQAGDVLQNCYLVMGKTLFWSVYVFASDLTGTASAEVRVTFPAGLRPKTTRFQTICYVSDGASGTGRATTSGATYVAIQKQSGNYTLNSGATHIAFTLVCELL